MSLAFAGDLLEEIHNVGDIMPSVMEARYGFVPPNYRKTSYLSTVSKLLSAGEIERKTDSKGEVFFKLTSLGKEKLIRRFPVASIQRKNWDHSFMVVIFDIDEKSRKARDMFRMKLKELGFGLMQKSVWISPYHFEDDLKEFIVASGLDDRVIVLKAQALFVDDIKKLAQKIWKIDEINNLYKEILESNKNIKDLWRDYLAVLSKDPLLPKELLPKDWAREKVVAKLEKLALPKHSRS